MAKDISAAVDVAFRDHVTLHLPASGLNEPVKSEIRNAGYVIQAAVDEVRLGQTIGLVIEKTWTALAARTTGPTGAALVAGTGAEVIGDAGTHTDPVVGGTVSNTGRFRWSASPAGWERIGAAAGADSADAAAASAASLVDIRLATYPPRLCAIGDSIINRNVAGSNIGG